MSDDHASPERPPEDATERPTLPRLRRPRRALNLARLAGLVSKGVAAIDATREPFARHWDRHNAEMLEREGPLWVALGDSVTQGIGAGHPEQGYVNRVLHELDRHTGESWRVVNLSMSGGRFSDVVEHQLPAMRAAGLEPRVVTAVIGSNDVIWRRHVPSIVGDARRLVEALPAETVLSRLSEAGRDKRRLEVNAVFDDAARRGQVELFEAWRWPTPVGMWAEDRFHPNDRAYLHMAENLWEILRSRL